MMELFNQLDGDNFIIFAAKHYYNPTCIDSEDFFQDLNRFKYLKRHLNRYYDTGEISERLILNHIIVIFNVFGIDPALKMLEYKLEESYWPAIKPFLIFLRYIKNDDYTSVNMDKRIVEALRRI